MELLASEDMFREMSKNYISLTGAVSDGVTDDSNIECLMRNCKKVTDD